MRTLYAFFISGFLSLLCHAANACGEKTPFANTDSIQNNSCHQDARIIRLQGSIQSNKVILEWKVTENQTADQFEVQRSTDGKNFVMAALVFGTDKNDADQYQFYEKMMNKKVSYRIKMINKDQQTVYSTVIDIDPKNNKQ